MPVQLLMYSTTVQKQTNEQRKGPESPISFFIYLFFVVRKASVWTQLYSCIWVSFFHVQVKKLQKLEREKDFLWLSLQTLQQARHWISSRMDGNAKTGRVDGGSDRSQYEYRYAPSLPYWALDM